MSQNCSLNLYLVPSKRRRNGGVAVAFYIFISVNIMKPKTCLKTVISEAQFDLQGKSCNFNYIAWLYGARN